jgi:hypothetical protein
MQLYPQLFAFFKEIAPTWRKTQLVNFALLGQAIFQRRSLVLAELARAYPIPSQRKVANPKHGLLHRVKRLWRFLRNTRLDQTALRLSFTRFSYSVCLTPGSLLPILVDLTYFQPFAVLSANVPRGGRALPIDWRVFARDLEGEPELSQNLIIEKFIAQMLQRIAPGIDAVIVADREFAVARFFRFLKAQSARFAIRVDAETWILHPSYQGPLAGLGLRPGGRKVWLTNALYAKEEREEVNLLAVWASGQQEPWFIATNLDDPILVERMYRKRMKIEHGYRDWKHHLRLKGTPKVQSAGQLEGLIDAVIALYWYVCLLGQRLQHWELDREVRCWGRLGDFKKGLELLALDQQPIRQASDRLVRWAADKLIGVIYSPPAYSTRRRHLCCLNQSG